MEKTVDKASEKAVYFLERAKETSTLETKLVLLNNAYNCLVGSCDDSCDDSCGSSCDGLKPAYAVVSMGKDEYRAIINACINDSDCDAKCSLSKYNLALLCKTLQTEVEKFLICR